MSELPPGKFPPPQKRRLVLRAEDDKTLEFSPRGTDATRPPFSSNQIQKGLSRDQSSLARRENASLSLENRERALLEAEARLESRERAVWEAETLLKAREEIMASREARMASSTAALKGPISADTEHELLQLREQLERQQIAIQEQELLLREREQFLEEGENRLMEITIQQQEEESRLDQLREDLTIKEMRLEQLTGSKS